MFFAPTIACAETNPLHFSEPVKEESVMAQDIFIKINGVEGESLDAAHRGEIEVLSWHWAVSQPANMHAGSGGGAGKSSVEDLCFVHRFDKASTNLLQYCLSGKHIPEAVLTVRKAGGSPLEYLRIILQEIIISGVRPHGTVSTRTLRESVALSFSRVRMEYVLQNSEGGPAGTVAMGYDIKANKNI